MEHTPQPTFEQWLAENPDYRLAEELAEFFRDLQQYLDDTPPWD
jgi:hypothetical protein